MPFRFKDKDFVTFRIFSLDECMRFVSIRRATMTIHEIQREIRPFKRVSIRQLQNYMRSLRIRHVGARQCPQQYPDTAPYQILKHLGITRRAA